MIIKLNEIYELTDLDAIQTTKDLFELVSVSDKLNEKQKKNVKELFERMNELFMRVAETRNAVIPAISQKDTVLIYELDYVHDGSIFSVKDVLSENNDGTITHFDVEVLSNL